MAENNASDITSLTVQLLSAFVSKNEVSSAELADLIKSTRAALTEDLVDPVAVSEPGYSPAVSVRKSLSSPDQILSLIDGKPYKTLKRHLTANGLTEKEYRERYNLPASYPMVAPNYSQMRSAVAQSYGLGKKSTAPTSALPAAADNAASADAPAAKAQKAPAKPAARKTSSKGGAAKTEPVAASIAKAEKGPAAARPAARTKLSIFGSKVKHVGSSDTSKGEAATAADSTAPAEKSKSPKKAASSGSSKPKPVKSALKAAGAHLGIPADKQSDEPAA